MTQTINSAQHCLYRFWNETGDLLYVGITCDPGRRWPEHMRAKPWWTQVASITLEQHADRHAVLVAEARAIAAERPIYNIAGGADAVASDEMPDCCSECDSGIYWPHRWRDGVAFYLCRCGHRWTCGWGHASSGDAPGNAGRPR